MAILSCHVSIKLPPKISDGQKLYNYRWKKKSLATTEARYELERLLHSPCLPFRITETRPYRANFFSTTVSGVAVAVASDSDNEEAQKLEPGYPAFGELNLESIGRLPYEIILFKSDVKSRHVPHGVFFTVNGQVHGQLPQDYVTRQLKFDYLSASILVSVDCTSMERLCPGRLLHGLTRPDPPERGL